MRFLPLYFFILVLLAPGAIMAQEPQTIKIKRESDLSKAVFDNTEMKLIIIDRFGNPRENKITSYKLYVKGKRETVEFEGYSNYLTPEMISHLNKQNKATKIFFTGIRAKDEGDHLVQLPDVIESWFPECNNCTQEKKRRR